MSRWFRVYDEILDDAKVQRLPPVLFKAWVNLLAVTSRCGGNLPDVADIAFALRSDEQTVNGWLDEFAARGLLDEDDKGTRPHNWNARQFRSDADPTAAERQARKRARDKELSVTPASRVTSRPPEAETETEDADAVARERVTLADQCLEAAGLSNDPKAAFWPIHPIANCRAAGASVDLDILPTLARLTAEGRKPRSWSYFEQPIMDAMASRLRPAPIGHATGPPRAAPSRPKGEGMAALDAFIHELKDRTDDHRSESRPNQAPVLRLAASC
jgi:hypothetical protein